jgi:hypothetical protein
MRLLEVEGVEKFDASWSAVGAELERSLSETGAAA